jgi:hypothetical protein
VGAGRAAQIGVRMVPRGEVGIVASDDLSNIG